MDEEHIKKRQKELSKQQAIYVASRAKGASKVASAIHANYSTADDHNIGAEKSIYVQKALAKARAETAATLNLTKEDIARGFLEAVEMARTMADPQTMVRAYAELGKMLGFYAEEKKKLTLELGKNTIDALRGMSDNELLKLAKGTVIEGEVVEKTEETDESLP